MVGRPDSSIDFGTIVLDSDTTTSGEVSANVLDLKDQKVEGYKVEIRCNVAVAGSGSETVNVKVQTSDDNSTYTDLVASGALAKAKFVAKTKVVDLYIPAGQKRYLRVIAIPSAATMTAGTIQAEINTGR